MKPEADNNELDIPLPCNNPFLLGHADAESVLLEAFASGKLPHAWIISGQRGIGKATLAYRFARFLFRKDADQELSRDMLGEITENMDMEAEDTIFSKVAGGSHGDLMVVDTQNLEGDKAKKEISIDEVRKINAFLSMTPAESSWRVVIVDSADEMNRNAANALLKILEEPPKNAIILLISHAPGRLLPTIRSRCRFLKLKPLGEEQVGEVLAKLSPAAVGEASDFISALSEGSPGIALELYKNDAREIYIEMLGVFSVLPRMDISRLLAFAERISPKKEDDLWRTAIYILQYFIAGVIRGGATGQWPKELVTEENDLKKRLLTHHTLDNWVNLWEKIDRMLKDTDRVNTDRKQTVIAAFHTLKHSLA